MQDKNLQNFIADKIDDSKGQDIIKIDVRGKSSITDCMIICTGTSSKHIISIAENIVESARAAGFNPYGLKGLKESDWVVVDLGDVIVHIMQEESRQHYDLEKLWS